jgi:diaminopimelate decarboxylase
VEALDAEQMARIADGVGTPFFVYNAKVIRANVARVLHALQGIRARVYYSAKANPAVGLAVAMRELGLGVDACSPGDLELARLAGFERGDISYTSFGASDAELVRAARASEDLVLDSSEELERLIALGIRRSVGVRVNPAIIAGFHPHVAAGGGEAKFGVRISDLPDMAARALDAGLPIAGVHGHLGSDILSIGPHIELLRLLLTAANEISTVAWVNLGGGFGTPRDTAEPQYPWQEFAAAARCQLARQRRPIELRLEPGGHLLMDAGFLVATVTRTRIADGCRPTTVAIDASTNHMPSVLLYGASHAVQLLSVRTRRSATGPVRIAGNLMQAGDVLAEVPELSEAKPGDLVAFSHVGAYASSRSTTFNERPRAAEVLVDGREWRVLRRPETVEELFARDVPSAAKSILAGE